MQNTKTKILAATMLLSAIFTGAAEAARGDHMDVRGRTSQPIGHALFCQNMPEECAVRTSKTEAPKLTRKRWQDIIDINAHVNRTVNAVTDQDLYGVEEHWTYPRQNGDCEDFALLKRYMLMQRGWPASSLLITVVLQPNGEGHAVLTVRTDRADYVLDNLESQVKPWSATSYKFLKRQAENHSGRWLKISDRRREVARF